MDAPEGILGETMEKVIVLADLHLTADQGRVDWIKSVLAEVLARHGDARAIVMLGDLTDDGRADAYAALRDLVARVSIPLLPMCGNHDKRKGLLRAFPGAQTTHDGHLQGVFDLRRHRLITLDSLDAPPYRKTRHGGRLCPDRVAWLIRALDGRDGRHPIVFCHHPPMKLGIPGSDAIRLDDGPDLLELLADYPGAQLICGHVHRAASGISRGVPWATVASATLPAALCLDDEEIRPGSQPPGYGVLLLQKHGVALHHADLPVPK